MPNGNAEHMHERFDWSHDPNWRIFRIMAEFVDGFDFLAQLDKTVSIFGSARFKPDTNEFQHARELASKLGAEGFGIITGGGPGIMEAANEGAKSAKAQSIGLNIQLPSKQRINPYVTKSIGFEHFYTRKVMLSFSSEAYVFFPGGYGTLDEMFEMITLVQTRKIQDDIPIILYGTEYWQPLCDWLRKIVLQKYEAIDEKDLHIWTLTDDVDEIIKIIKSTAVKRSHIN